VAQPAVMVEPLEPATLTDMLDGGWRLLHEQPGTVLALSALCLVPATVVSGLASAAVGSNVSTLLTLPGASGSSSDAFPLAALLATVVAAAIRSLGVLYLGVALTDVVTARQWGTRLGATAAMGSALRRSGAILGAWPLLAGGAAVSYAMCFLPLAVWLTFTAVVAPAIAAEGIGPIAAIGRSMRLVARRFWMALGVVMLSSLVATVLTWILTLLPSALAEGLPWGARWAVNSVASSLAAMLTAGPLVTASVLLYLDLRVRTEGLDLRQRATVAFSRAG
jgi:hypothetical protein